MYSPVPVSLLTSNKRSSHLNVLLSDRVLPIVEEFTLWWDELVISLLTSVRVLFHSPYIATVCTALSSINLRPSVICFSARNRWQSLGGEFPLV